jgi:hypothetical protein
MVPAQKLRTAVGSDKEEHVRLTGTHRKRENVKKLGRGYLGRRRRRRKELSERMRIKMGVW